MKNDKKAFRPDHIMDYFRKEWAVLLAVTISGLIYNLGLLAGPWFEGRMTGCLVEILNGSKGFADMLVLVLWYVAAIAVVQICRYVKRFYVRRFSNNVNRKMKQILYGSLVRKSRAELEEEGTGNVMTKAILDVDDCAEGMRKFTTEIFDTGVAMAAYAGMLLWYDWKLTILCMIFPPISYILAEKMKVIVQRTGAACKEQSGALSAATLDQASNAITYRVFGCEKQREEAYEQNLAAYEKAAVRANIWNTALPPLYKVISMAGVVFILYFGGKNVLGTGWQAWSIAVFTTFLSCFTKLSVKSSRAAKLFNAVHKAQVSWKRIKPLLKEADRTEGAKEQPAGELKVKDLSFAYPGNKKIYENVSFTAKPGTIIGITGPVACGKSTLGKTFLCEYPYEGSATFHRQELRDMDGSFRTGVIGYLGHDPELFNDSVEHNVLLGEQGKDAKIYLKAVCLDKEVEEMENGLDTLVGNGGVRLSGGQAQRLALARTLCHKKPVLILDDPFSALDKKTEEQAFENLKKLAGDSVILLISHRLYLFPQMDQVIWMENGQTQTGTHEELMKRSPEYAKLYLEQAEKGGMTNEQ
ncbi:MAG: ABC transporter ATP-binding protein [Lachnospiraceae bacterium]